MKGRRGIDASSSAAAPTFVRTRPVGASGAALGPVRVSTQPAATAKRRKLSDDRYSLVFQKGEEMDGLLRRRTVKSATRTLYERVGNEFLQEYGMNAHSPVSDIDRHLDQALVRLFLAGESQTESNVLYYAVRHLTTRTNAELRLSFKSRQGHCRTQRGGHVEPETWEAVLLMCRALLDSAVGRAAQLRAAMAATGFLLSFDVYGRGTDVVQALRQELRPPQGTPAGAAADL